MRCYDGAPDSELQALMARQAEARRRLEAAGLHATYFPMEEKWRVYDDEYRPVTGFCDTIMQAADAALIQE